jgi:hypothetical protein
MGFVVDKAALEQVYFEYFAFFCQAFHRLLHIHHPSSGAGTIGQIVDSLSPYTKKVKKAVAGPNLLYTIPMRTSGVLEV